MHESVRFEPWPGTDWPQPRALIPAWLWQLVVAAALGGALLLAFHRVVQGAVSDGERRRQQDALFAIEFWHCNTMGDKRFAEDCLRRLGPAPHIGVRDAGVSDLVALDR